VILMRGKCPYCGGTPTKEIPSWVSYIKCEWCGRVYEVKDSGETRPDKIFKKKFDLFEFKHFLETKKNIRTFDPVSGILIMFGKQAEISEDGIVNADPSIKNRIEKWIYEFLLSE